MAHTFNPSTQIGSLKQVFSKVAHVYYSSNVLNDEPGTAITVDMELPVLEDSVSFDTGSVDKTEVKLTTGTIWTSKSTKGDSDITFQVASLNSAINELFLGKDGDDTSGKTHGYSLDVKKATGALYFVDETGKGLVVLPNVEMYGSLVLGEGDNPAYFNVTVTPTINSKNASIYIDVDAA